MSRGRNVLMIYPRFHADSFWSYSATCELVGARYPTAPLGLITVAALLPPSWPVRLVNRNTEELTEGDLAWADMVFTGGMLMQQPDTLDIIDMCRTHALPVVVGGPDVTESPHIYAAADFRVRGEAEGILDEFIAAWEDGATRGVFEAERFTVDVTKSPVPRFDLLKFDQYLYVGVQFSRGCPFNCEFCDIIELYGRVSRAKTGAQMLAELDALHQLGYRGHVDFVDDNLIGNKQAVRAFLPELKAWLQQHDYPFEFTTEASINLADDAELMKSMSEANFCGVFVGIESPDTETLIRMNKKQNTRRNIPESIHRIYSHGMFVLGGFIVGFDSEKGSIAEPMLRLVEDAAIPICMIGLLQAQGETQLGRRLMKEGRLYPGYDVIARGSGDHCEIGLNFDTLRPKTEILHDYRQVLERTYSPDAVARRLQRLAGMLDCTNRMRELPKGDARHKLESMDAVYRIVTAVPEARDAMWQVFTHCVETNPRALRYIVTLMSLYIHFSQVALRLTGRINDRIRALQAAAITAAPAETVPNEVVGVRFRDAR